MAWLPCPYLGAEVELTEERWAHIIEGHPPVAVLGAESVAHALADPDWVGTRPDWVGFATRLHTVFPGHDLVVVVRWSGTPAGPDTIRYWVVTAWVTRRPGPWEVVWRRA